MIELKVQCDCGQKYKFDVEPVNGRMGYQVTCPVCGRDGTEKGNAILQEKFPGSSAAPPPPPPPRMQPPGLRINSSAHAPTTPAADAPPPIAAPRAMPGYSQRVTTSTVEPVSSQQFALGVAGAVAGGVAGMIIWFLIFKYTGLRLGILALGVGALTGYGAKLLGRCHSSSMGLVTATCALLCIFGAQYLKARSLWHSDQNQIETDYQAELAEARKMVEQVPNGTDEEIRKYLMKENAADGAKPGENQITADEIKFFRELSWQKMKDLEGGKPTREQYITERRKLEGEIGDTLVAKIIFWVMALGIFNIVSIIAGTGLAYKIGIGEK